MNGRDTEPGGTPQNLFVGGCQGMISRKPTITIMNESKSFVICFYRKFLFFIY